MQTVEMERAEVLVTGLLDGKYKLFNGFLQGGIGWQFGENLQSLFKQRTLWVVHARLSR